MNNTHVLPGHFRRNMRRIPAWIAVLSGLLCALPYCLAQSEAGIVAYRMNGSIDLTFSADGRVTTNDTVSFAPCGQYFNDDDLCDSSGSRVITKVDDQGRAVVAATTKDRAIRLTRYRLDGAVDVKTVKSFDCLPGSGSDEVRGMTINGSYIIVVGVVCGQWRVVRFNDDFSLDLEFGRGGTRANPVLRMHGSESIRAIPNDVVVDRLRRIFVVGNATQEVFNISGSRFLDEAIAVVVYSWRGEVITDRVTNVKDPSLFEGWSLNNTEFAEAATLHGNAIVIVGNIMGPGGGKEPVILRLRFDADPSSGRFILSPDESFGDTQSACTGGHYSVVVAGCRRFEFNRSNFTESRLYAVDIDSHNRIIVAGVVYADEYLYGYHQSYFGIARLTPNGDLDTAFNQIGIQVIQFGPKSLARSVVVDQYDRITAGGWTTTYADPYTPQFALLRLLSHGTPDPTFGNGTNFFSWGRVTTNLMCSGEEVSTIALDEKYAIGRIIAAGRTGGGPVYCLSTTR